MASVLLLGGTDLTLALANRLVTDGTVALAGVVSPAQEFRISYSASAVGNTRAADMSVWCRQHDIPFTAYGRPDDIVAASRVAAPEAALVAGWYHYVPARMRRLFPRGCIGLHASLLPRYRGGAPLNWALLNGEADAGVTLFELGDGIDDGPIYDQRSFLIESSDYIGDLVRKAEEAALAMVAESLRLVLDGSLASRPQEGRPSYGLQRQPADGVIDWRRPAAQIARLVRGVSRPYPGARAELQGQKLVIWRARVADAAPRVHGAPGQVVQLAQLPAPAVVTGDGLLLIEEIEGAEGFDVARLGRYHQQRFDAASC